MKALFLESTGPHPSLAVREVPNPAKTLSPQEVLIAVEACGLCYHDLLVMQGILRRGVRLPLVLGHEIAGHIADIGHDVTGLKIGDRVISLANDICGECYRCLSNQHHRCLNRRTLGHSSPGGLAEYIKVRRASILPIPDSIPWEHACLLACPVGVGLNAVRKVSSIKPGRTVVITGAGGGLGTSLIQVTKLLGAQVIAITTSPEKEESLRRLGADHVLGPNGIPFSEIVLAITNDAGADVVLDCVGSPMFTQSIRSLSQFGHMIVLGEVSGEQVSLNLGELLFRDATITAITGTNRTIVEEAVNLTERGLINSVVHQQMPWDRISDAVELLQNSKALGRIVLKPPR